MNANNHAVKPQAKKTAGFVRHDWITERLLGIGPVYRPTTIPEILSSSYEVGNLFAQDSCLTDGASLNTATKRSIPRPTPGQDRSSVNRSRANTCESWGYTMCKRTGSNWVGGIAALDRTENPGGGGALREFIGAWDAPTLQQKTRSVTWWTSSIYCSRPGDIEKRYDEMDSVHHAAPVARMSRVWGKRRCFVCLLVGSRKHDWIQVPNPILAFTSFSVNNRLQIKRDFSQYRSSSLRATREIHST